MTFNGLGLPNAGNSMSNAKTFQLHEKTVQQSDSSHQPPPPRSPLRTQ